MKKLLQILRKIFKFGLIVAISPAIFSLLLLSYCSYEMRYSKLYDGVKFDKQVWSGHKKVNQGSSSESFPSVFGTDVRCKMYNDIVTNHLKIGMKLEEVEELLGYDKSVTYCKDEKTKCIEYLLGTCYSSSFTLLHNELVICLNRDQKVVGFGDKNYNDQGCKQKFYCIKEKCECTEITRSGSSYSAHSIECPFKIDKW